jgi:GNAT superfamily N-acetyltransferase
MNDKLTIQLIPKDQIQSIMPLLQVLNESIAEHILQERLSEMLSQGYQYAGIYDSNRLVGICGLWLLTKCYVGKHIELDNVIVLPEYRSKGLGKQLMAWVYAYGKSVGCVASELNCYLPNEQAHSFWENEGFKKIAYHFQREL